MTPEERKLLRKGIHRAYQQALVAPPFSRGSGTERFIETLESWGVDFSVVDVRQFAGIRVEE